MKTDGTFEDYRNFMKEARERGWTVVIWSRTYDPDFGWSRAKVKTINPRNETARNYISKTLKNLYDRIFK